MRGVINGNSAYTLEALKRLLEIGDATIREGREAGILRASKIGRKVMFLGSDVVAWVEKARVVEPYKPKVGGQIDERF